MEKQNPTQILLDLVQEVQATKKSLDEITKKIENFDNKTNEIKAAGQLFGGYVTKIQNLLSNLPMVMTMKFRDEDQKALENIHKRMYLLRTVFYLAAGVLTFAVLNLAYVNKVAIGWYKEANRSEKEILVNLERQKRTVVDKYYLKNLEDNTAMMQEFVKKKPKDAEKLLDFESGFKSKK